MRHKMLLKNFLHILFALSIFITSCSDPRTVQLETPTTGNVVQQLESSSTSSPATAPPQAVATERVRPTATGESPIEPPPTTAPQPTATIPLATSNTTTQITPAPLATLPIAGVTDNPMPNLTLDDVVQRANALAPLLQGLRNALDRSQFDLIALNRALAFDGAAIVDFVRDEIFFEQYVGVLRGAEGALLGRAGNALDQSILLTTLLEDAGYESRIAHGTLSTAQATALVNQMAQPRSEPPAAGDKALLQEILDEIMALQGFSAEQRAQLAVPPSGNPYQEITESDTQFILNALDQAGVTLGDPDAMDALIEEARDYYWVEYRLNAFDPWETAHPAFADAPELVADETFIEPPTELYHRVRFETFIEQKIDDQLIVNPIVEDLESTTADLVGRPFVYQNQPNNLDYATYTDMPSLLAETGHFLPIINNELAGSAFDLDGRIYEMDLLSLDRYGVKQIFQTQARQLEQAIGALDGIGADSDETTNPDDFITLTAHWIEYTLIAPNGFEVTHRRYALDRIGAENRANQDATIIDPTPLPDAAQAILTTNTVMVLSNHNNVAYNLDRYAQRMLQEIALMTDDAQVPSLETLQAIMPWEDVVLNSAFEDGHSFAENSISYRPSATVAVYQEGIVPSQAQTTLFERVDVVANPRRVFTVAAGEVAPSIPQAIRAGVWETHAEGAPMRLQAGEWFNTMIAIRTAQAAGIGMRVLNSADLDTLATLSHSAETKANLRQQLEAGYAIIIPESATSSQSGWWRVDPATGETLGMTTGNYGQAQVEYVLLIFSLVNGGLSTAGCVNQGSDLGCCLQQAYVSGLITFAGGYYLAALAGLISAQAATGTAILFGVGTDTFGVGVVPNFCPTSG